MARTAKKPASYHHGDLRRALIAAAISVVEEDGVSALSLVALARKAGVSSGAPYHHFGSREQLLAAIAVEGFAMLCDEMKRAADAARVGADETPAQAYLRGIGRGYVRFALANRGHFRVMFRPELKSQLDEEQGVAAKQAFVMLQTAIERLQADGTLPPGDPRPHLLLAWSAVHGASVLWIDGPLSDEQIVTSEAALVDTIAESVTRALQKRRR